MHDNAFTCSWTVVLVWVRAQSGGRLQQAKGPREITLIPTSALDLHQTCNIISGKFDFEVFQIFGNNFTHVLCLGFSFFTSVWISIAITHTASSYVWLICNLGLWDTHPFPEGVPCIFVTNSLFICSPSFCLSELSPPEFMADECPLSDFGGAPAICSSALDRPRVADRM